MEVMDRLAALWWPWLLWTSLQTLLLASLVALLDRCLPRLSAATRCLLWWLVGLQVLAGLGWRLGLVWPWPPGDDGLLARLGIPAGELGASLPGGGTIRPAMLDDIIVHGLRWLFLVWLGLLIVQVLISLGQAWQAHALRRRSQPLQQDLIRTLAGIQARDMGLRRLPELRTVTNLGSPVVSGLWRPMILLPATCPLAPAEAAMMMAHELAHLRRGDLWLGWVPTLARHLLCFHPALLWSNHAYRLQRESACDSLAMQHSREDPQAYGRLLLQWGEGRPSASQLGSAATGHRDLQWRLQALRRNQAKSPERRWQAVAAMLLSLSGVLPYRLSLADPALQAVQPPPMMTPITPAMAPLPVPPPPVISPPRVSPPLPPPAPVPAGSSTSSRPPTAWAAFDGQTLYFQGGSGDQARFARHRQGQQPVLWYRRGQQVWLSHDPALIRQVILALQSPSAMAVRSHALDPAQRTLLQQQWRNAREQSDLAARQADLAASQARNHRARVEQLWQARLRQPPLPAASMAHPLSPSPDPGDTTEMDKLRQRQQVLQEQMQDLVRQQQVYATPPQATGSGQAPAKLQRLLEGAVREGRATPVSP